jgi:hypothetical protein
MKNTPENSNLYPSVTKKGKEISDKSQKRFGNLKGKTLELYYFLAANPGEHGVREIQKEMSYSSPSVAAYHLDRLYNYDLIRKTDSGKYFITGDPEKLGELKDKILVLGNYIPKIILYSYHGFLSIIATLILWGLNAQPIIWVSYFLISNIIFLGFIIRDTIISAKIREA